MGANSTEALHKLNTEFDEKLKAIAEVAGLVRGSCPLPIAVDSPFFWPIIELWNGTEPIDDIDCDNKYVAESLEDAIRRNVQRFLDNHYAIVQQAQNLASQEGPYQTMALNIQHAIEETGFADFNVKELADLASALKLQEIGACPE